MEYTQAGIAVENTQAFDGWKAILEKCLVSQVEDFLKAVDSAGLRIRQFEEILAKDAFDRGAGTKAGTARARWDELTMSDKGLVREKYLTELELVKPEFRRKYQKLYRYS